MPYAAGKHLSLGRRQEGYAFLLMLALLIAGSLYAIVQRLDHKVMASTQAAATAASLTAARDALLGYAVTYRESHPDEGFGHFPCPDISGDGTAETSCNNVVTIGLLPYKTLGLPDLRDASGACLWYAVSAQFRNNPKSDPLNWDAQGQITVVDASGKILQTQDDSGGGVAVVIFAPGAPLGNQGSGKLDSGYPCGAVPSQVDHYLESTTSPFRQGPGLDASGATVLNDQLLWLSSADVSERIRARTDFATYINAGNKGIQSALSFSSLAVGSGNTLPTVPPVFLSASDQRFYLQWQDQFRYLKCSPGSYCYQIGSQQCDGALLFGGENSNGKPRASTERTLRNYFESPTIDLAQGNTNTLSSISTLYAKTSVTTRMQDLALCLTPRTQTIDLSSQTPTATASATPNGGAIAGPDSTLAVSNGLYLGQVGVQSPAYGCLWYPEPLQLGASATPINLRAYFEFNVATRGQGFTLALADADSSINPSPAMCGRGGAYLGYTGENGETAEINYPKIALEVDTHKDATSTLPLGDADDHHLAFVYWGRDTSKTDDNTHGASDPTDPQSSSNPASGSAGYLNTAIDTGITYAVRLEMKRTYRAGATAAADVAIHELRAYIMQKPGSTTSCRDIATLTDDLSRLDCELNTVKSLLDTLSINRVSADAPAPMKQIWVGFTSGQDQLDQRIRIPSFRLQVSQ